MPNLIKCVGAKNYYNLAILVSVTVDNGISGAIKSQKYIPKWIEQKGSNYGISWHNFYTYTVWSDPVIACLENTYNNSIKQ